MPGRPRATACSRAEAAAGSEARAAAPTAAYWSRSSGPALAFHGQQFGVQEQPGRVELGEQPGRLGRLAEAVQ